MALLFIYPSLFVDHDSTGKSENLPRINRSINSKSIGVKWRKWILPPSQDSSVYNLLFMESEKKFDHDAKEEMV